MRQNLIEMFSSLSNCFSGIVNEISWDNDFQSPVSFLNKLTARSRFLEEVLRRISSWRCNSANISVPSLVDCFWRMRIRPITKQKLITNDRTPCTGFCRDTTAKWISFWSNVGYVLGGEWISLLVGNPYWRTLRDFSLIPVSLTHLFYCWIKVWIS